MASSPERQKEMKTTPRTQSAGNVERLAVLVVIVASLKFLFQGGPVTIFGTADASTYAMFLAPILGAHGYMHVKRQPKGAENPDAN